MNFASLQALMRILFLLIHYSPYFHYLYIFWYEFNIMILSKCFQINHMTDMCLGNELYKVACYCVWHTLTNCFWEWYSVALRFTHSINNGSEIAHHIYCIRIENTVTICKNWMWSSVSAHLAFDNTHPTHKATVSWFNFAL